MDRERRPYDGPKPYIFVSYARKDADTVFPYLYALMDAGYRVWYDIDGIPLGKEWSDVIADHIAESAVCLAFHSEASKESQYCRQEVHYAMKMKITMVSVYVDGVQFDRGLEMQLSPYQAVKLWSYPTPASFAARLGEEEAFASCRGKADGEPPRRVPPWQKSGKIQWRLDGDGVLTIAKNAEIRWLTESIPNYKYDAENKCSTAPWMPYRERIRSVVIQRDIDAIGDFAFKDCSSLTAVKIPDSVTTIGNHAFSCCHSLTTVNIPASVTTIGDLAFFSCKSLTAVEIPNSVTSIGKFAFNGCTSLTAVTIPDSVTSIGDMAFCFCVHLTAVEVPAGAEVHPLAFDFRTRIMRRGAAGH